MINTVDKKNYAYLFFIYFISNFFVLLNYKGVYWDDWCIYNQSPETIDIMMNMLQYGVKGIYIKMINSFENSILLNRLFVFITYFTIGVLLYNILKTIKYMNNMDVFWITSFFMILPLNHAKIFISISSYSLPLLSFFIAFWLLSKYLQNHNLYLRISILSLFFISFETNSILVFYAIPLSYIYFINYDIHINYMNLKAFFIKYIDFILLPIIYFVIKKLYFVPWGSYEGYNAITIKSILLMPYYLIKSFYETLYISLTNDIIVSLTPFIFILILIISKYKNKDISSKNEFLSEKRILLFFSLGVIIFILSVIPYSLVSKLPTSFYSDSRHQILTPLGISFVLYYSIILIVQKLKLSQHIFLTIIYLFIFSFTIKNINNQFLYIKDWIYHEAVKENFIDSDLIKYNTTFIVRYNSLTKEVNNLNFVDYELNGMMREVYRDDSRLMVNKHEDIQALLDGKDRKYKYYNMTKWVETKPIYISINLKNPRTAERYLIMLYDNYHNINKFKKEAKDLIFITQETRDEFTSNSND